MTTAIQTTQSYSMESLKERDEFTKAFCAAMGITSTSDIMEMRVKLEWARALNIEPAFAKSQISIIKGSVVIGALSQARYVKESGKYNYRVTDHTRERCEIHFFEHGEPCGVSEYTIDDAKKQGLLNRNPNWSAAPRNMLFARALTNGVRWYCPDVLGGAPVHDEYEAEIIDHEPPTVAPQKTERKPRGASLAQRLEIQGEASRIWGENQWAGLTEWLRSNGYKDADVGHRDHLKTLTGTDAKRIMQALKATPVDAVDVEVEEVEG